MFCPICEPPMIFSGTKIVWPGRLLRYIKYCSASYCSAAQPPHRRGAHGFLSCCRKTTCHPPSANTSRDSSQRLSLLRLDCTLGRIGMLRVSPARSSISSDVFFCLLMSGEIGNASWPLARCLRSVLRIIHLKVTLWGNYALSNLPWLTESIQVFAN
jgi:hypothetical protein